MVLYAAEVFVASWQGRVVRLLLERRPGMEAEDVLEVEGGAGGSALAGGKGGEGAGGGGGGEGGGEGGGGGGGGIWSRMKSMFGAGAAATETATDEQPADAVVAGSDSPSPSPSSSSSSSSSASASASVPVPVPANPKFKWKGETIHIFSVASGHLYERFLKIMMLSVRRNTNNPLKFWFIKNWLSPRFKDFLPHIAAEYGFEYELVTYKWPTWHGRLISLFTNLKGAHLKPFSIQYFNQVDTIRLSSAHG